MKEYVNNVILVMSGGVGTRFGADCPKQYCMFGNRMVIDYVMDACRKTKNVDRIVIVASVEYKNFCEQRFNVPVVVGGASRPESVANGLKFIYKNYKCKKLIITNAVCPLATSKQYDQYFDLLDNYDYVLTTWKLAPALHRFDEMRVDRDDFFNVMEPDAYKFEVLYENFDFVNMKKYIFHNMPLKSKGYYCFDYPYTMKLTYSHDLKLLEVLYNDIVVVPNNTYTLSTVNKYLSADGTQGIDKWIIDVQQIIKEFVNKYELESYTLNSQTEANIVYEAISRKFGACIIKFTPSRFHFNKEKTYYQLSNKDIIAELIDCVEDYNALIIKMLKPGMQVRFDVKNVELKNFFDRVSENLIPLSRVQNDETLPNVMCEFEEYVKAADKYVYEYNFRKIMEKKARVIWNKYFKDAPKYYLHRDLHKRNLLFCGDKILAIDPRGTIGPKAFEFVIQFIIELRDYQDSPKKDLYETMFDYFSQYIDKQELRAALFIFWVYKMNDYVFQKNDNYKLAGWCKNCILNLFFNGLESLINEMPIGL